MKKVFGMLLVLTLLIGCLVVPTTSVLATGSEDYVWVVRECEIGEDFFTADEVKMNLKLWWQWESDEIVPYTIKVKKVELYLNDVLTEEWIPSRDASLVVGRDDITDPAPVRSDEEGVVVEEGASKGTDYQLNMWSNGATMVPKGTYTVQIRVLAAVYSEEDYWRGDTVRFCLWNEENGQPFKETFAATEGDGEPISFDEWEEGGTEGFNTPKPTEEPTSTPEQTEAPVTEAPTEIPTEAPTETPATEAPTEAPATDAPATSAPVATEEADTEDDTTKDDGLLIWIIIGVVAVAAVVVVVVIVAKKKKA